MRNFLPLVVLLLASVSSFAQNDFRSRQSGDWSDSDTWEEFNGTSWQNTATVPDESAGVITVESFMTVTIRTAVTANELIIPEDAILDIVSGGSLVLIDAAGTELDIAPGTFAGSVSVRSGAVLENQGEISSTTTNLSVSGEFIHNRNGGEIPPAGWASGSKLTVRGVTSQAPAGFGVSFSSLEWDCDTQTANVTLDGPLGSIGQDLLITSTNDQRLTLNNNNSVISDINGDFVIGSFSQVALTNSGTTTLTVHGQLVNDGILRFATAGGNATIRVENSIASSGDIYGNGSLAFTGSGALTATITGGTFDAIDYLIPDDAEVDFTSSILDGTGTFTAGNDVILHFGLTDPAGTLQNSTTGGALRVAPSSRTFGDNPELVFNGTAAQFIGDGVPSQPNVTLRINNASGVSLSGDLTATGDVLLTLGNLSLAGHHLTVEQTIFSGTGYDIVPDENAVLEIQGSGNFGRLPLPAGTQSFKSLILNRSGGSAQVELTSDVIIHEDLVLTDGRLVLENNTLELRADIVTGSGDLRTVSGSGIRIAGSGAFSGIPFSGVNNDLGDFIYERSGETFTTSDNMRIHNELGLYAGTVDNASDAIQLIDGAMIRRIDGILSGNQPNLVSGQFNVRYEGSPKTAGLELPPSTEPDILGNLIVSEGPVTLNNSTVVNGNVQISAGTLEVTNADLTVRGSSWVNNSGEFTHTNGTLLVEGTLVVSGSGTEQFADIQILNAASLSTEMLMFSGDLVVEAGGTLNLDGQLTANGATDQQVHVQGASIPEWVVNKSGGIVSVNEPLRLTGDLRIETASELASNGNLIITTDPADVFGGGRVDILPAGASVTGEVVSEWYQQDADPLGIPMYFGSTVSDATVSGLQDDILVTGAFTGADGGPVDPSLFIYDETIAGTVDNGWDAYPVTDNLAGIEAGRGYQAWVMGNSPVTIDLSGTLNQGDVIIPVSNTDSGTPVSDGWNLVANPYASSIGWDQLNGWDKSFVRSVIAVNVNGKFKYYNSSGAGQGTQLVLQKGLIAKHQAFWVQAISSGNLVVGEQTKAKAADVTSPVSPANQMLLSLSDGTNSDQALIVVSPGATSGYDPDLDAPKFDNRGMDIATVSADGTRMAFNFLEPLGCGEVIEVYIGDVVSGGHTLSVNTLELFDVPYLVTLRDNFLNVDHNVNNQPNYTFTVDDTDPATYENRFSLIFEADLDDLINENLSYSADNTICEGETGTVTFPTSQSGVTYQLELNGSPYGNPQTGTGATLFFDLVAADMAATNTLKVIATPAECATPVYLTEEKAITKSSVDPEILYAGGKLASNYTAGNTWYFNDLSNQISTANEITPTENGTYILTVSAGGCSATISYEYVVTSLEKDVIPALTVYPNPADGQELTVLISEWDNRQVTVEVITASGRYMEQSAFSASSFRIDVGNWAPGVYLLRITSGDQVYQERIIRK